jgi:prephenate dehydratase
MQDIIKVAIQGDKASFHEIAAYEYFNHPIQLVYCRSFKDVFMLLSEGSVDRAFVAVSNSNYGEIDEVKWLIGASRVLVEGEYLLPIQQHVIGIAGSDLYEVETVVSHPIALSQSSVYVDEHFRNASIVNYHDTAASVRYVKDQANTTIVAIGSEAAAELYGLTILQRSIQNDPNNATLFKSFTREDGNKRF